MEKKFYTVEEAAEILGLTPAEVNRLRERNELRAFRDGPTWKFPIEDVHRLAQERRQQAAAESADQEPELELAPEDQEAETVFAPMEGAPSEASIELGQGQEVTAEEDELLLIDDETTGGAGTELKLEKQPPTDAGGEPELELAPEEELSLADSQVPLAEEKPPSNGSGGAALNLAEEEEEDLVIGGSGGGSDVTIGQDSGISLVDPQDSGLSLEEPVELEAAGGEDDSLALGEDDMLTVAADEAPTEIQAEEEFRLTTDEEAPLDEETESASQMIPLDLEGFDEGAATIAAEAPEAAGGVPFTEAAPAAAPAGPGVAAAPAEATMATEIAAPAEAPFGTLAMVGLILSLLVLALTGMMLFDLVRNMWSWSGPTTLSSQLMDFILSLVGK